ncbi:MAG TPA: hypothetical protein DCY40_02835 [Actinobacteria bacterium]|nr:hypothetical protein [Actinomycetota bacterium]
MSWIGATWRGLLIVAFFFAATVWLPDFVLGLDAIALAPSWVRDLGVLGVWGAGFVGGLWALRLLQRRRLI